MSCWPWRRPRPGGGAGPARLGWVFPGESVSSAASFGPGCRWTCYPAARAWHRGGRRRGRGRRFRRGVPRLSWSGCWPPGRSEARRGPQAVRGRGADAATPPPRTRSSPPNQVAYALARSAAAPTPDRPGPDPRNPAARHRRRAGRRVDHPVQGEIIARATALLDDAEARAAEQRSWTEAGRLTPGRLRAAIAPAGWRRPQEAEARHGSRSLRAAAQVPDELSHLVPQPDQADGEPGRRSSGGGS
jgi:hypothetical protein